MSGPGPPSNKGIEERLDRLHAAHLVVIRLTIFAVFISIAALVVAYFAWRRPVAPVSEADGQTHSSTLSNAAPTNTPLRP